MFEAEGPQSWKRRITLEKWGVGRGYGIVAAQKLPWVLSLESWNVTLFVKQGLCRCHCWDELVWEQEGPRSDTTSARHRGKMIPKDGGRDCSHPATSPGAPGAPQKPEDQVYIVVNKTRSQNKGEEDSHRHACCDSWLPSPKSGWLWGNFLKIYFILNYIFLCVCQQEAYRAGIRESCDPQTRILWKNNMGF